MEYYIPMKINYGSMQNMCESQYIAEGKKQDTQKLKHTGYKCFKEVILEEDNGKLWHFGDIFLIGGKSSWKNTHIYIYVYSLLIYLVELFFIWS